MPRRSAIRFAGGLLALSALACGPLSAQVGQTTDPKVQRQSLYVPVRDGTRLAVNIYRSAAAASARQPTIFAFTPYRARYFKDGKIEETFNQKIFGFRDLVQAGYAVVIADVRGKGASFGARRGFLDRTEALDGRDLVQWVARQPWSDGQVGLTGCSYLGGTTMLIAGTRAPAVKAVFSAATDLDKYSFVRNGGITAQFNTRPDEPLSVDAASVPVDGDTGGVLLKQAVTQHAANTPMAKLWAQMPFRDSVSPLVGTRFWEEVGPYTHLSALRDPKVAWYFWSNWEDEPTEQMILAAENIPGKLIIGPGSHCEAPKQFDIAGEQRRFFDHHLRGAANGIEGEPRYTWWQENGAGGTLVRSNRLPGVGVKRLPLYLAAASNQLAEAPSIAGKRSFRVRYDLNTDAYFAFWPAPLTDYGPGWTSPPLQTAALIQGYPIARIRAAVDRTDAILFAYVEDVAPDGTSKVVSHGRLAASHRKLSPPPYRRLDLPYHSGLKRDVAPMVPGVPAELAFSLSPRAYTFAAGHRIRVTLTGADPRQRNLAELKTDPAPVIDVLAGGARGSRVDLPFVTVPRWQQPTRSGGI